MWVWLYVRLVKDLIGIAWVCEHILPTYCKIKSLFKTHSHGLWLHRGGLLSLRLFSSRKMVIFVLCEYYVMLKMGLENKRKGFVDDTWDLSAFLWTSKKTFDSNVTFRVKSGQTCQFKTILSNQESLNYLEILLVWSQSLPTYPSYTGVDVRSRCQESSEWRQCLSWGHKK